MTAYDEIKKLCIEAVKSAKVASNNNDGVGVLMMHLSDLMKSDAAANLPEDRQYRFYSRCMSVVKAAQEFSMKIQENIYPVEFSADMRT
jgi:hypothetical protein